MSWTAQPEELAVPAAEEVLRTIYGDDLEGCAVSLESIGAPIADAIRRGAAQNDDIFDLYEKLVEALNRLSSPPPPIDGMTPEDLHVLLSERLDAIRELTANTITATAPIRAARESRKASFPMGAG